MTLTKSSSESSDESDGGSDGDDEGSGSGSDVSLIGSWEYDMGYEDMTMIYEFVSDGTFNFGSGSEAYYAGTWSTNGDQLCFVYTGVETETCYTYSISGDGNQLTMTYMGVSMVLTKIYVI